MYIVDFFVFIIFINICIFNLKDIIKFDQQKLVINVIVRYSYSLNKYNYGFESFFQVVLLHTFLDRNQFHDVYI
jgi:hypothetical protein